MTINIKQNFQLLPLLSHVVNVLLLRFCLCTELWQYIYKKKLPRRLRSSITSSINLHAVVHDLMLHACKEISYYAATLLIWRLKPRCHCIQLTFDTEIDDLRSIVAVIDDKPRDQRRIDSVFQPQLSEPCQTLHLSGNQINLPIVQLHSRRNVDHEIVYRPEGVLQASNIAGLFNLGELAILLEIRHETRREDREAYPGANRYFANFGRPRQVAGGIFSIAARTHLVCL